jgi:hypothetical protein
MRTGSGHRLHEAVDACVLQPTTKTALFIVVLLVLHKLEAGLISDYVVCLHGHTASNVCSALDLSKACMMHKTVCNCVTAASFAMKLVNAVWFCCIVATDQTCNGGLLPAG